jgi:AraC-like DNA-binding protein
VPEFFRLATNRSDKPVKQIAEAGFRIEKSFIRAFREWTGMSPREFRRGAQGLEGAAMTVMRPANRSQQQILLLCLPLS